MQNEESTLLVIISRIFSLKTGLTWDILNPLWLWYFLHSGLWNPYEWIKICNHMKSEMSIAEIIHKNNLSNEKEYFGINMIISIFWPFNGVLSHKIMTGSFLNLLWRVLSSEPISECFIWIWVNNASVKNEY